MTRLRVLGSFELAIPNPDDDDGQAEALVRETERLILSFLETLPAGGPGRVRSLEVEALAYDGDPTNPDRYFYNKYSPNL